MLFFNRLFTCKRSPSPPGWRSRCGRVIRTGRNLRPLPRCQRERQRCIIPGAPLPFDGAPGNLPNGGESPCPKARTWPFPPRTIEREARKVEGASGNNERETDPGLKQASVCDMGLARRAFASRDSAGRLVKGRGFAQRKGVHLAFSAFEISKGKRAKLKALPGTTKGKQAPEWGRLQPALSRIGRTRSGSRPSWLAAELTPARLTEPGHSSQNRATCARKSGQAKKKTKRFPRRRISGLMAP